MTDWVRIGDRDVKIPPDVAGDMAARAAFIAGEQGTKPAKPAKKATAKDAPETPDEPEEG